MKVVAKGFKFPLLKVEAKGFKLTLFMKEVAKGFKFEGNILLLTLCLSTLGFKIEGPVTHFSGFVYLLCLPWLKTPHQRNKVDS